MDVETFKQTLEGLENKHLDSMMLNPKHYEALMRFEEPTKWELFLEGFYDFWYALESYDTIEHFPDDFWEALSSGWYDTYIYPYDDIFYGHIPSPERKLRLGQ